MEFTAQEQADLAAHEEILAELLRTADKFLPQHPEQDSVPGRLPCWSGWKPPLPG